MTLLKFDSKLTPPHVMTTWVFYLHLHTYYHDTISVDDEHPRAGHNTQHLDIRL